MFYSVQTFIVNIQRLHKAITLSPHQEQSVKYGKESHINFMSLRSYDTHKILLYINDTSKTLLYIIETSKILHKRHT